MECRYRGNFEKPRRGVGMRGLREGKCGAGVDELGERGVGMRQLSDGKYIVQLSRVLG
jgi:hypothetical protein